MTQFTVTGMSCAACAARVEKAVKGVKGVTECSVSLLTNSMGVTGGSERDIMKAVQKAGYGAAVKNGKAAAQSDPEQAQNAETAALKKRLGIGGEKE